MKEQPSKEERKRLLIEMMKEDEKNGMYEVPNFVEPILLKAGDKCVKINGQHPYVDCRIISEDNYQLLLSTIQKLNKFKIQAYELQSASQFKPSGEWIDVKDRLPEGEGDVLLLTTSQVHSIGDWYEGGWRTVNDVYDGRWHKAYDKEDITHWMPLPKPPGNEVQKVTEQTFTVEDMRRCWDCAKDIDRSKFLDFDTWLKCQIWTKP